MRMLVFIIRKDRAGVPLRWICLKSSEHPLRNRFVLTSINKRSICDKDFLVKENGGIILTEEGRKKFLSLWQQKKKEEIVHPFLQEKVEW